MLLGEGAGVIPPTRHATCLRYYSLEGDLELEALRQAVQSLGTIDAGASIAVGPATVSSRPKARFLVLELPSRVAPKEALAALKKVTPRTEELAWTAFQGERRSLPSILGYAALDCVVGMDNDLRWFDLSGGRARFYYVAGKLDEKSLRSRFHKLYQPFDAGELGELVTDAIEWKLAEPVDAAAAKAAEKAIAKIPGVRKAKIDSTSRVLTVGVEHEGLRGAVRNVKSGGEGSLPGRDFLVDDVLDALAAAKLAPE